MFGFFAFSGGSQFSISQPGDGKYVAIAMVNTMIAGNAAGVTTIILHRVIVSASRNCVSCRLEFNILILQNVCCVLFFHAHEKSIVINGEKFVSLSPIVSPQAV